MLVGVKLRHAHGALVIQNQLFQRAFAIADNDGKLLFRDRKNMPALLVRVAVIKHTELCARRVFLDERIVREGLQILRDLVIGANDLDVGAAFSGIRFEDDWIAELLRLHELLCLCNSFINVGGSTNQFVARNEVGNSTASGSETVPSRTTLATARGTVPTHPI